LKNPVGPVLRMGDEVELIIAAIEDDNPGTDIEVIVRVQGDGQITVTQQTLRRYLGADYEIRSFGAIMSAFSGRAITTSDAITWQSVARHKAGEHQAGEEDAGNPRAGEEAGKPQAGEKAMTV